MAGEYNKSHDHEYEKKVGDYGEGSAPAAPAVETQDRGLFDFLKKKEEEKPQEEVVVTEFEKVKVSEQEEAPHHPYESHKEEKEEEKKHGSLLEKLHRSDSSSSSSSDEEEGEGEERKKKKKDKKGLKDKIQEKISGDHEEDTAVPVEKYNVQPDHPIHHHEVPVAVEPTHHEYPEETKEEEKKGFLEKIKDKLPGGHKKSEEVPASSPSYEEQSHDQAAEPAASAASYEPGEPKEKKGILEKIKEKLPGYHPKTEEEKEIKEKDKDTSSY